MRLTPKQNFVLIRMGSDDRVPHSIMGYITDLSDASITEEIMADRLKKLQRFIPDLVAEFLECQEEALNDQSHARREGEANSL